MPCSCTANLLHSACKLWLSRKHTWSTSCNMTTKLLCCNCLLYWSIIQDLVYLRETWEYSKQERYPVALPYRLWQKSVARCLHKVRVQWSWSRDAFVASRRILSTWRWREKTRLWASWLEVLIDWCSWRLWVRILRRPHTDSSIFAREVIITCKHTPGIRSWERRREGGNFK